MAVGFQQSPQQYPFYCYISIPIMLILSQSILPACNSRTGFNMRVGQILPSAMFGPPSLHEQSSNLNVSHSSQKITKYTGAESYTTVAKPIFSGEQRWRPFLPGQIDSSKQDWTSSSFSSHTFNSPNILRKPISSTESIISTIFQGYRSHERPPSKESWQPTIVEIFIDILDMTSIDVSEMEYTVDLYLRQRWYDSRLAWETIKELNKYNETLLLTDQAPQLWLPDLFFRNGKKGYVHELSVPNKLIRVDMDGKILFSQKITMTLSCSMYLGHYPMDRQRCYMDIGSYAFTLDELKFVWLNDGAVQMASTLQLLEFDFPQDVKTIDCTEDNTTSTGTYTCLLMEFKLQRLVTSYIVTTYIPEVLIVMVSWLGFWIDVRAVPARITLGLLTLLGLLTEGSSLCSKLPRVTYMKAIDVWLGVCLLFVLAALAELAIAYMQVPKDGTLEWELEAVDCIQTLLMEKFASRRCCCCYTGSSRHKPQYSTNVYIGRAALQDDRGNSGRSNTLPSRLGHPSGTPALSHQARSKSLASLGPVSQPCQICSRSAKFGCCQCPQCVHLQCPKASKMTDHRVRREPMRHRECHPTVTSVTQSTRRKKIIIKEPAVQDSPKLCEPLLNQPERPRKSALKVTGNTRSGNAEANRHYGHSLSESEPNNAHTVTNHKTGIPTRVPLAKACLRTRQSFLGEIISRFLQFWRCKPTVPSNSTDRPIKKSPTSSVGMMPDSRVDAISRFLFPLCFLIFNCCYWLFYMVIVQKEDN